MKLIVLAAGKGERLRPLTNDRPKCMVEYKKKPIIDYIIKCAKDCKIKDIAVVGGYKKKILQSYLKDSNIVFYKNNNYNKTNMVATLFCAEDFMDDDLVISYADIVYKKDILKKLINNKNDFSLIIDRKWKDLWTQRMDDPLKDAETLKIKKKYIIEIGKKPKSYNDIHGQYIGLIKISKNILKKVITIYKKLDRNDEYDNQNFNNMYMTTFIQRIINNSIKAKPIFVDGGWVEIDSIKDLSSKMI